MKKITGIFLILFISTFLMAQSGIDFSEGQWADALSKAKENNKLVFVDAYASWCGPCKAMAKEVFPQDEVGTYFNENFINVKLDMEKGEGLKVAKLYNVRMYPTFLFINSSGELIHRAVGYHQSDQFIELGASALDPARQLTSLATRYENGDRSADLLKSYTKACYDAGDPGHGMIATEYLNSQTDWSTKGNMEFLLTYLSRADSKAYKYLIQNREAFNKEFGENKVTSMIKYVVKNTMYSGEGESISLEEIDQYYKEAFGADADKHSRQFRLNYYQRAGDAGKYAQAACEYYSRYDAETWNELNGVAWTFFEEVEDKKMLKKAVKWAKSSIAMESNYYNNDTMAALLYKLGKMGKAKKAAYAAIEIAKANNEDYSETSKLLDKINGNP